MNTVQQEQIEVLTTLTKYCNDGYYGYSEIADKVEDSELQTIFNRLSQQRKLFAEELNNEILALGGNREETGSTEGFIHKMWINIKSLFTNNDLEGILTAAKTGEEFISDRYAENLSKQDIPSFIREKLIKQHSLIKGASDQLISFEKTMT